MGEARDYSTSSIMLNAPINSGLPAVIPRSIGETFTSLSTTQPALIAKGAIGQSVEIFKVVNSSDATLFSVDNSGNLTITGTATISVSEAVVGNISATGNLSITGTSAFSGAVAIASSLSVSGSETISGSLSVGVGVSASTLSIVKDSYFTGNIYLSVNSILDFNNGDIQLTNSSNALKISGGDFMPATSDGSALGTSSLMWSDLFLASGAVINFNNGDIAITHSANNLAFSGSAGATLGYSFDNNLIIGATAAGATAVSTLVLSNSATAPTTSVDKVHLFSVDNGAGHATLAIFAEETVTSEVVSGDTTFPIKINGTIYKMILHT